MTGFGPKNQAPCVWCKWTGNVNPPSIQDSFSTSSITDGGTGYFDINFSNTMANDDFSGSAGGDTWGGSTTFDDGGGNSTTKLDVGGWNASGARQDQAQMCCVVVGDLA
tara:strand:+ start:379 stop:705 length:327 start_codon:yes stop_codon:yes gene_type:complete